MATDARPGIYDIPVGPPRRRFGDWLRSVFEPDPPPPPPAPPQLACRQEAVEPLFAVAQGDAYDFEVYITLQWRVAAYLPEGLEYRTSRLAARARRTVLSAILPVARDHAPHRARELETALNRQLAGRTWQLVEDEIAFVFSATVRVVPDQLVRERLRPYWQDRIEMECRHELGLQRAELVNRLTQAWSEVFARMDHDPRTMHAARLSEAEFAQVFREFVTERGQSAHRLAELLETALRQHADIGMPPSEFTAAWDEALKAFRRQHADPPNDGGDVRP
jgi:hypothetical protein